VNVTRYKGNGEVLSCYHSREGGFDIIFICFGFVGASALLLSMGDPVNLGLWLVYAVVALFLFTMIGSYIEKQCDRMWGEQDISAEDSVTLRIVLEEVDNEDLGKAPSTNRELKLYCDTLNNYLKERRNLLLS